MEKLRTMTNKSLAMFLEEKLNLEDNLTIHSNQYDTAKIDIIAEKYKLDELIRKSLRSKEYKTIFNFLKNRTSYSMTRAIVECTIVNEYYISPLLEKYTPYEDKQTLFRLISDSEEIRNNLSEDFEDILIRSMYYCNPKQHVDLNVLMNRYIRLAIYVFAYDILEIVSSKFTEDDKTNGN